MTLAQIIERYEATRPQPAASAVTPKGLAVVAIAQIKRALIDLDPTDREDVRAMVADMLILDRERGIYGAAAR